MALHARKSWSLGPAIVFLFALVAYWLTVEPAASWWDCPEYLTTALRLEIGHPPGNPFWTLTHRFVSAFGFTPGAQVLLVNMMAGVFTALASALLASVCQVVLRILFYRSSRTPWGRFLISFSSAAGALCFAWADSPWFSAVEAEVYAMSIFFTALSIWLMVKWAFCLTINGRGRLLVLIGYVTGLSIGVHQLNLLCIPAMTLIFVFRRMPRRRAWLRGSVALIASFVIVACILGGMMPSMPVLAGRWELTAVNSLGLPYGSGAIAYVAVTLMLAWILPFVAYKSYHIWLPAFLVGALLFLSGLTSLGSNLEFGGVAAFLLAVCAALYFRRRRRSFQVAVWMLPMLLTGYCVYLIIPIRAWANPPMNQGNPSDPFTFYSYLQREQYGSAPLFYGRTPQSRPLLKERADIRHESDAEGNIFKTDTVWRYSDYVRDPQGPQYARVAKGAVGPGRSGLLSPDERHLVDSLTAAGAHAYVMADRRYKLRYTPELDMWFPRIWSSDASDMESFRAWVGMDTVTMVRMEVSETLDADGNPAGKRDKEGLRHSRMAYRPTYMQALRMMLGYQFGYMYGRYHLWNFMGRQNDISSTGEADHGNFITGIPAVDDMMLGPQENLPPELGSENRGRNIYFGIPLLLGIVGIVFLSRRGRGGRRLLAVALALFFMTGLAIVFYLNQAPGEPRERDYSFLGSLWAYAFFIGCGAAWILSLCRAVWLRASVAVLVAAVPLWMLAVNFDDHDRSGRYFVEAYAENVLNTLAPDAIIVVQGDNVTFPLWYAQHVLGVRPDVTIVNASYLGCPWYIEQLRLPTAGAPGLELTMPRNLASYGAYTFTGIDTSHGDSVADGVETLRRLYASEPGKGKLGAACLALGPEKTGNRPVLDLRPEKTGASNGWLNLGQLVMADMVVSNAASAAPRPLYWHSSVGWPSYAGAYPLTRRTFSARRYAPQADEDYLTDDVDDVAGRLVWGGLDSKDNYYIDEVTAKYAVRMRHNLLFLALAQEKEGCRKQALETLKLTLNALPGHKIPYTRKLTADSLVDELKIVTGLIARLEMFDDEGALKGKREEIIRADSLRTAAYLRYRHSLPARLRPNLSPATRSVH